jgi:hypothetical protein
MVNMSTPIMYMINVFYLSFIYTIYKIKFKIMQRSFGPNTEDFIVERSFTKIFVMAKASTGFPLHKEALYIGKYTNTR